MPIYRNSRLAVRGGRLTTQAQAADKLREMNIGGYLSVSHSQAPASFNAGYSIYTAAWTLVEKYQGHKFQSGLYGTWMFAQHDGRGPDKLYSDIEGGLGWWMETAYISVSVFEDTERDSYWAEQVRGETRTHVVSIANSYPEADRGADGGGRCPTLCNARPVRLGTGSPRLVACLLSPQLRHHPRQGSGIALLADDLSFRLHQPCGPMFRRYAGHLVPGQIVALFHHRLERPELRTGRSTRPIGLSKDRRWWTGCTIGGRN